MLRSRWIDGLWLLAFGLASSAWCLTAAAELGATFDEPLYLNAGLTVFVVMSVCVLLLWSIARWVAVLGGFVPPKQAS